MELSQLLANPAGRGSHAGANRARTIADLKARYASLKERRAEFSVRAARGSRGSVWIHVVVPSEELEGLTYDVVLRVEPPASGDARPAGEWDVRVWSNSPAFMYTYTYVAAQDGLIPRRLLALCSAKALKEEPKVRNPHEEMGYEKSIFFALFHLQAKNILRSSELRSLRGGAGPVFKASEFKTQEGKLKERERLQLAARERKKAERAEKARDQEKAAQARTTAARSPGRTVPRTASVKKVASVKKNRPR